MDKYTVDEVLDAVEASRGVINQIAQHLRCSRTTVYSYAKRYATVRQAIDDAREDLVDNVENALYDDAMTPNNTVAKIYLLNNLGRPRGWSNYKRVEQHVTTEDRKPQTIRFGDRQIEF